jgi:cob(I)alamin adenosyltransferase
MGTRLSRIYTRTGDEGTTGLTDGTRVTKDDLIVQAMGSVDELNSAIGVVLTEAIPDDIRSHLTPIQHRLFDAGGELSMPGTAMIERQDVDDLEAALDELNEELPPLENFVMPGGTRSAAHAHMARAICRRAERDTVALHRHGPALNTHTLHFLNRLSDLLFVVCRRLARIDGGEEVQWAPRQRPSPRAEG